MNNPIESDTEIPEIPEDYPEISEEYPELPDLLDKYMPWTSKQLAQPVVRTKQGNLTFGDLCKSNLIISRYSQSGKASTKALLTRELMSQGYGWFGISSTKGDVLKQIQWAFDADRIIYDEETGEVSGGVYILGSKSDLYTVKDENGKEVSLFFPNTKINFFEALIAQNASYASYHEEINFAVAILRKVAEQVIFKGCAKDIKFITWPDRLLKSLLTLIYSIKQNLDIDEIHSMVMSLPCKREDIEDRESDWKTKSYFAKFMRENSKNVSIAVRVDNLDRNLLRSVEDCLEVITSLSAETKSRVFGALELLIAFLRRNPLYTMMFSETDISPETIRQGNIFICGLSRAANADDARAAAILYKAMFQQVLTTTPRGKGAVIWGEEEKNMEDDNDFRASAVESRTISVYEASDYRDRDIDFEGATEITNNPLTRFKNAVFGLLRKK